MLPHRVCCVPTQFPSEPRCTGVQRRPLCTDCCWYHVCWTGVQMVVIAGQPGKQTLLHDDPHTEGKHTRTHTYTRAPIKALARENVTSQLEGTEEWRLTCLHCDNEATHRRAFLQARAALAGSEVQQCYSTPPSPQPQAYTPVLQVISGWAVTGQEVSEGLSESPHYHTLTFPSLFPDERFLYLKALLAFSLFSTFLSSPLFPQHPSGSLSRPPTLSPLVSLTFAFCPRSLHFFSPLLPPFVLPPHSCAEAD